MSALTKPSRTTLASVGPSGELTVWRAADGSFTMAPPGRRGFGIVTFLVGAALTAGAAVAVWHLTHPVAVVSTRIMADAKSAAAAQAALAQTAVKIPSSDDVTVGFERNGTALAITAQNADEVAARRRVRAIVDSVLRGPIATPPPPAPLVAGHDPLAKLLTDRTQLVSEIDAVDSQMSAASARLTSLVHDIVEVSRANANAAAAASAAAAERRPGRETIDKSAAMLAELQLQLIELKTKFQDDYPAVVAVERQIRSLRMFIAEENRRLAQSVPAAPKPPPDPADALLDQERERLKTEMADLDARRATLVAQLAAVDRDIAAEPSQPDLAATGPAPPPAAVLVEASTTVGAGPDSRQRTVPAVVGAGLLISLAVAFLRGRRATAPGSLKLYRIEDVDGTLPPQAAAPRGLTNQSGHRPPQ